MPELVPSRLLSKFDITNNRFKAITFLVYVIELLAMNKFLTNLSTTPELFTKSLPANSRPILFTRAGKATLRLTFVKSVMVAHQKSWQVFVKISWNQSNLLPPAWHWFSERFCIFMLSLVRCTISGDFLKNVVSWFPVWTLGINSV